MSHTDPTYQTWKDMWRRCTNPEDKDYERYSRLGICERWRSWKTFLADMGPRPPGLTLERIDNEQGYSPDNCRWATRHEQNLNRRNTLWIRAFGLQGQLRDWHHLLGIAPATLYSRIKAGMDPEQALLLRRSRASSKLSGEPIDHSGHDFRLRRDGSGSYCRTCKNQNQNRLRRSRAASP